MPLRALDSESSAAIPILSYLFVRLHISIIQTMIKSILVHLTSYGLLLRIGTLRGTL